MNLDLVNEVLGRRMKRQNPTLYLYVTYYHLNKHKHASPVCLNKEIVEEREEGYSFIRALPITGFGGDLCWAAYLDQDIYIQQFDTFPFDLNENIESVDQIIKMEKQQFGYSNLDLFFT